MIGSNNRYNNFGSNSPRLLEDDILDLKLRSAGPCCMMALTSDTSDQRRLLLCWIGTHGVGLWYTLVSSTMNSGYLTLALVTQKGD